MLKAYWRLLKFRNSYFQKTPFKWLRHTMIKQKQGNVMLSVALIGVHKNFAIFTGKHLWQSLFINKVEHLFKNAPGGCFSNLNCWTLFGSEIEMGDHDPLFLSHWLRPSIYHCSYVNRIRNLKKLWNFIFLSVHNPR